MTKLDRLYALESHFEAKFASLTWKDPTSRATHWRRGAEQARRHLDRVRALAHRIYRDTNTNK